MILYNIHWFYSAIPEKNVGQDMTSGKGGVGPSVTKPAIGLLLGNLSLLANSCPVSVWLKGKQKIELYIAEFKALFVAVFHADKSLQRFT